MDNAGLLRRFVGTFGAFDDLRACRDLVGPGDIRPLLVEPWDLASGFARWKPIMEQTPRSELEQLYQSVPGSFPDLYEQLALSYRWYDVDIGQLRLVTSLGPGLIGLQYSITKDRGLFDVLTPAGYVQFGKGPDVDYDPVCFDFFRRRPDGDCPIVKFDHEEILQNKCLVEVGQIAPSFRELVERAVHEGERELASRSFPEV